MINLTFRKNNRLFALSFKNGNNDSTRNSFDRYNLPLNSLIDNKLLLAQPVKNNKNIRNLF